MQNNPYFPDDWFIGTLQGSTDIVLGQSPPSDTYNTEGVGLPFYQGKAEFGNLYPTPVKWCTIPKKIALPDDILISVRAPVGPTNVCQEISCIGRGLAAIRAKENNSSKYIFYYLRFIEKDWDIKATGTTFKAITRQVLRNQEIPIPPYEEQEQIVAKIEELFSQLDAGVEGLKRVQAGLKRYKASVLKAAFEGRLVPQDPNDEPAEELLKGMGKEPLLEKELKSLPIGWCWTKLESLIQILDNQREPINSKERDKRISSKDLSQLFPYYGATGQVGWIDKYIFDEELLLLGEDGAPFLDNYKNKAYIVRGKYWVNNHAHVIRALVDITTNKYLLYYLNNFDFNDYVTGTTRLKLNQGRMKEIPVILPPLSEQNKIIAEIEKRLSIVASLEKVLEIVFQRGIRIRQSILQNAFIGKLVNQSTDEKLCIGNELSHENEIINEKNSLQQGSLLNGK